MKTYQNYVDGMSRVPATGTCFYRSIGDTRNIATGSRRARRDFLRGLASDPFVQR